MNNSVNRRRLASVAAGLLATGASLGLSGPLAAQSAMPGSGTWLLGSDFGATGDGLTDDSASLQMALDTAEQRGGGMVILGSGVFRCNLTIGSRVSLVGMGPRATTLISVPGANRSVIEGRGFADWTGTDKGTPETRGANYVGIANLCIDGNRGTNERGCGIRIWGRAQILQDLIVQNCAEDGIFLEFTTHDAGEIEDDLEGFFTNIKTIKNGGNGWTHRGPHDSILSQFVTFSNDGWGFKSEGRRGSYNGGISGMGWNSWLNGLGSFHFGATPGFLSDSSATGESGTGIELLAEDSGSVRMTGILISGHEIGLYLRGSNHTFSGVVLNSVSRPESSPGRGIVLEGAGLCLIDVAGSDNDVAMAIISETGPNIIRGRFNVPADGQLLTGNVSPATTVDLAQIGAAGSLSLVQIPTVTGSLSDRLLGQPTMSTPETTPQP